MATVAPASSPLRPVAATSAVGRLATAVRAWPTWVADGLLALVVVGLHVLALATFDPGDLPADVEGRAIDLGAYLIIAASSLPLVVRRRFPVTALVVASAGLLAFAGLRYLGPFTGYAMLAALYAVMVYRGTRWGVAAGGLTMAAIVAAYAMAPIDVDAANVGFDLLIVATALALGDGTRNRMAAAREHEARTAELARDHERRAQQAVADERARIARELHDLVAHSMSVVAVQAGVGHHLIERNPDKAKEALATIEATSRQALTEMRRLLGVLRTTDEPDRALNPQPGLGDLDPLLLHARDAGIEVELVVKGERRDVPSGVELSAYRIVQEALTNAVKHAGPARAEVTLGYEVDGLTIEVADDGRGLTSASDGRQGYGLVGMRERAAVVGGEVSAGPRPGGGFRVVARLPYGQEAAR